MRMKTRSSYLNIFSLDVLTEEEKKAKEVLFKSNLNLKEKESIRRWSSKTQDGLYNRTFNFYLEKKKETQHALQKKIKKKGRDLGWAFGKKYFNLKRDGQQFRNKVQVMSSRKISIEYFFEPKFMHT
eukprot:snap_masked-scaffold_10-processed-gene-1.52-mRNA-1 protein AED:1.00 eAED:1.00 QI:0/0/0/0/1/1/4/0/126